MNKKNIKIIYQYDGSKFYGFQRQRDKKTVQGEIEKIIEKSFGEKINLISSGRTDKGVHGLGQVSNFFLEKKIPLNAIKLQINKRIGKEIKILKVEEVTLDFHSRYDAKARTYLYIMKKKDLITPFESEYITGIEEDINIKKLEKIMKIYEGEHNFSSFMKKDKSYKNPIREIYSVNCSYDENKKCYYIEIAGSSFLKTMVRIMIGTALEVYFGKKSIDYIKDKLINPNQNTLKTLASSEGLYLYKVDY